MSNLPDSPRDRRPLLARLLDTPQLAHVIPRLQPEVLHRVIERCGLEDCGELVALATPAQLAGVLDLDLWRSDQPGLDEQFNADRFGVWLEVLLDSGAAAAARTLAGLDAALVTGAFAQHVRIFDPAALSSGVEIDGEEFALDHGQDDALNCEVGGYLVVARRTDAWDAIVTVLMALGDEYPDAFDRVMRGCRGLSNAGRELDGLDDLMDDGEQVMFDLAVDRERRRERQGYVTPAQARAFLQMSREPRASQEQQEQKAPANPVATAYFRAVGETIADDAARAADRLAASDPPAATDDSASLVASLVDLLIDEGALPPPPRALLSGSEDRSPQLARMQSQMQWLHDRDAGAYASRSQELAYLANTLVAGCAIQARPMTVQEASDAAVAVCNLGLENWPAMPEDLLVDQDLVSVFQVGWSVLYRQVCMYAAEQLIDVLTGLRCDDHEIQAGLDALRSDMTRHWRAGAPWHARDAMDVLTSLDTPAWAALLGLIDECPVMHAAISATRGSRILSVSPSAFGFISENSQIASIRDYLRLLPATLRG